MFVAAVQLQFKYKSVIMSALSHPLSSVGQTIPMLCTTYPIPFLTTGHFFLIFSNMRKMNMEFDLLISFLSPYRWLENITQLPSS